ncbi:P-loop containing nucleoside triphosphate hydrolase protein [Aspergillus unguis]
MAPNSSLAIRSLTPEVKRETDLTHGAAEISTSRMEVDDEVIASESLKVLAQTMTTLVKKVQDLRHIGIEDSHITLPKICVIGDQSTGKSSLIEGMSEIKVPRSAGTCTRCPMEINLSGGPSNEPWTCRVYLSRKYVFDGTRKLSKPNKSQPLGPWISVDQEDDLFTTINDKADIEQAIRWAQLAILNPGSPPSRYIPGQNVGTDPNYCEVKFSPNIVRLDISAPGFPSLSFYDLPGVINQVERDEERYLVNLVENLVKKYICQENCIVLLTIPMTDDVMNSSAARIMNDVKGAKSRALGVLTKPDRVQTGESYDQWIGILEGAKFSLEHKYFVVRNNPNPAVEHAVARDEELAFFMNPPWTTELAAYRDRFGTRNLQTALSKLLFQQIQGCLPSIIREINDKAKDNDDELSRLPPPPTADVPFILCRKLYKLKDAIRCQIEGGSREYPLQKMWSNIAEDFKRALARTRPTVRVLAEFDKQTISVNRADDDSECEIVHCSTPKRKFNQEPSIPTARDKATFGYHTTHFDNFTKPAIEFTWEGIRDINKDSAIAGIPQQINPKAIDRMNQMSVEHWQKPMMTFIIASHKLVLNTLLQELENVFLEYTQTGLFKELTKIIKNYLRQLRIEHLAHVDELYQIEHHKPFTMATSALDAETAKAQENFESRRFDARANHFLDLQGRYARNDSRREAEKRKLGTAELGPDTFALEVRMMAITRGYYEIASSRFVDAVCQTVHTKLFSKCREHLVKEIEGQLGIQAENGMPPLLYIPAALLTLQRRRHYLEKQKEKFLRAQEWLNAENCANEDQEYMMDFETEIKTQPMDAL